MINTSIRSVFFIFILLIALMSTSVACQSPKAPEPQSFSSSDNTAKPTEAADFKPSSTATAQPGGRDADFFPVQVPDKELTERLVNRSANPQQVALKGISKKSVNGKIVSGHLMQVPGEIGWAEVYEVTSKGVQVYRFANTENEEMIKTLQDPVTLAKFPLLPGEQWKAEDETMFMVEGYEDVDVPAGKFKGCLRLANMYPLSQQKMTYWYAPQVGLVKMMLDGPEGTDQSVVEATAIKSPAAK